MPLKVSCPSCQHAFSVPDDYAGRKGKCPKCRHVFQAPNAADDIEEFPSISEAPTPLLIPTPRRLVREEVAPAPPPPKPAPPRPKAPPARRPVEEGVSLLPAAEPLDAEDSAASLPAAEPLAAPAPTRDRAAVSTAPNPPAVPQLALDLDLGKSTPSAAGEHQYARRKKSGGVPVWMYVALGACVLLTGGVLTAVVVIGFGQSGTSNPPVAQNPPETPKDPESAPPASGGGETNPPGGLPAPPPQIDYDALERQVTPSLVMLQFRGAGRPQAAIGVLAGGDGLIATSYRAILGATSGNAILQGPQEVFQAPLAGVVAVDPARDLAVLRLAEHTQENPSPIALANIDPKVGDTLVMLAIESNSVEFIPTQVQRRPLTTDLPAVDRAEARRLELDDDLRWIQSTRSSGQDSAGLPLVNLNGQLVGLNSPLGVRSNQGFAVPATALAEMLTQVGEELLPWPQGELAAIDSTQPPLLPEVGIPETMTQADDLRRLMGEASAMGWYPENQQQYAMLQVVATRINELMLPEPWSDEVAVAAREVVDDLNGYVWEFTEAQRHALDEKADKGLEEDSGQGLLAFARVVNPPQKPNGYDKELCIMELLGTNRLIAVEVSQNGGQLKVGKRVFVVGRHNPQVRFTITEGGFERAAAVLNAKYLILEPAAD